MPGRPKFWRNPCRRTSPEVDAPLLPKAAELHTHGPMLARAGRPWPETAQPQRDQAAAPCGALSVG